MGQGHLVCVFGALMMLYSALEVIQCNITAKCFRLL